VPAALEAVCLKAMALKPQDRYATPRALAADVERWLADEPGSAYREPWAARAGRWAWRHRTWIASATTTMLALLLSAIPVFVLVMHSQDMSIQALREKEAALRREEQTTQRVLSLVMAFMKKHPEGLSLLTQQLMPMFLKFNPDLPTDVEEKAKEAFDGLMFGD
jgi:hypothetical protein